MIEQALYRLLSTDSNVLALVSTRIYPTKAPQNASRPYVIYQQITEQDIAKNNDGPGNLPAVTFQIDAYAESYAAAHQAGRAIRDLLRLYRGSVELVGSPTVSVRIAGVTIVRTTDFNETDVTPNLYRVSRDYRIIYAE